MNGVLNREISDVLLIPGIIKHLQDSSFALTLDLLCKEDLSAGICLASSLHNKSYIGLHCCFIGVYCLYWVQCFILCVGGNAQSDSYVNLQLLKKPYKTFYLLNVTLSLQICKNNLRNKPKIFHMFGQNVFNSSK